MTEGQEKLLKALDILVNPLDIDRYQDGDEIICYQDLYERYFKGAKMKSLLDGIKDRTDAKVEAFNLTKQLQERDRQRMASRPVKDEITGEDIVYVPTNELQSWLEHMAARYPDSEWEIPDHQHVPFGLLVEIDKSEEGGEHTSYYHVPPEVDA